jgi:hypothetical protein
MIPNLDHNDGNDEPTRPINDGPTLLRIQRLARVACERLVVDPDEGALLQVAADLAFIERLAKEALA